MESPLDDAVTIGPALLQEEDGLLPLMIDFNRAEGIRWNAEPMTAALRKLLCKSDLGLILVARERDARTIVGYAIATFGYDLEFAGRDAFVTELFVRPTHRRNGLGRKLLTLLIEALRARDTKAVHLMVRPDNELARSLYVAAGFGVSPRIMMTREL